MDPKTEFQWRLTVQVEQADRAAKAGDRTAANMARHLRALHKDVSEYPANHALFRHWQRQRWRPVAVQSAE